METLHNIEQGTSDWHESRISRFTSSEIHRLMADVSRPLDDVEMADPGRAKHQVSKIDPFLLSDGAMTYVYEKIAEDLTGLPAKEEIDNDATRWGKEWEPEARKFYERVFRVEVVQVGNIITSKRRSGSPDGLVGPDGGVEFKCPYVRANHVRNLLISNAVELKKEHPDWYWQVQDLMFLTGRKWFDWVSFHPWFEGAKKLHKVRIFRNETDIYNIECKRIAAEQMTEDLLNLINRQ